MSGAKLLQPTLTAGEVSPSLHARVDINRYAAGLRRCRNFIVRPYGGIENRPGFRYADDAGDTGQHRLIPFVFSTETAYVLVLGAGYMRFIADGAPVLPNAPAYAAGTTYALDAYVTSAGVVYRSLQAGNVGHTPATSPTWWVADAGLQITTPWSGTEIWGLRYTQSADVLYVVHPDHPPRELRRLASNAFELILFQTAEGPFLDLNSDESIQVSATGVQGEVDLTANAPIFTANAVGSLFYLETKDLGQIKPWVVGDRSVAVGALRRSEGKTYRAVTVPGVGTWHETGPRQPIHEAGRAWDGTGDSRTNGADTWSVGIEWEYVDSGYGVVQITSVTTPQQATGLVTKRLPAQVVGGGGAASSTWNLTGDGTTQTFPIPGAGYGVYNVSIAGQNVQSDPNYVQPPPSGGGFTDPSGVGTQLP